MDSLADGADGCRLCLDPFAECFTTIENPQLKDQMDKVFCFTIERKQGCCSGVCQSCSFAISEFYQYSEKVRQNQEKILYGKVTNWDPAVDSKISVENVNVEALIKSELQDTAEDTCEPMDKVSVEEVPILDSKIPVKNIKLETFNNSVIPESNKNVSEPTEKVSGKEEIPCSGHDERSSKKSLTEEDLLFKKHCRMICDLCGMSAETFAALNDHFKKEHNRDGYVVCCNRKLNRPFAIRLHIDWHANPDLFRCKVCGRKHNSKANLKSHMLNKHSNAKTKRMLPETVEDTSKLQATVSEAEELDSEITIENVKVETHENEASEEYDIPRSGDDESLEPSSKQSQTKSKGSLGTADEPSSKQDKEDQIFNKHFRMVCDLCGTSVANFKEVVRHFRKEHNRHGYVVCCKQKLFTKFDMREHLEFHANPDVFRCKVCGIKLTNKRILTNHMFVRHATAGSFQCDLCPQSFAEKSDLAFHVRRHAKVGCPRCHKTFFRNSSLGRHMADCGQFACDICGKEFTSKRVFDQHVDEHRAIEVKRFECNLCRRWMKSEQRLQKHMDQIHVEGNRQFQCDICLKNYPRAKLLYSHKLFTHAEAKFKCEFCNKKLKTNRTLRLHVASMHKSEMKKRRR